MRYDYQLAIIGGGSGGLTAADLAANLGLTRVVLIESKPKLGGECLHTGCVPSKALLYAAKNSGADTPKSVWQHVRRAIHQIETHKDNAGHYEQRGISVLQGAAEFISRHHVRVGNRTISSKYFLIATGSTPAIPPIHGLSDVDHLTNETVFNLTDTPTSLTIVGGGPIGCELASAFSLLGTKVTLIQSTNRLLPREEPQVSRILLAQLEQQKVDVLLNAATERVEKAGKESLLHVRQGKKASTVKAARLLLAAGRVPTTNLKLEAAGVTYNNTGITINHYFQTSQPNIFAVGDCTTSAKFTHLAAHQAGVALRNMITPLLKKSGAYLQTVPWITYTTPEIGRIGRSQSELDAASIGYTTVELPIADIDRSVADNSTDGFVRVYVSPRGRLLGGLVVARSASELLAPLAHIYYHNQPLSSLAKTVFPYPTLASGLNLLASTYLSHQTKQSAIVKNLTRSWRNHV